MRRLAVVLATVAVMLLGGGVVLAQALDEDPVRELDLRTALDRFDLQRDDVAPGPRFSVTLDRSASTTPVDGRVYVIVTRNGESEPREQISVPDGVPFFGRDVDGLRPGRDVALRPADPGVFGYPLRSLGDLPAGDYHVQAFMNVYTTFRRSDGSVVKLHLPCGDGHDVFAGAGNLHSAVQRVRVDPGRRLAIRLRLTEVIPPSEPVPAGGTCQQGNPPETEHVKHVKIRSERLSRFWGRDMYIGADVLLPVGYDEDATRRYPVVYQHGHFPGPAPFRFTEDGSNDFSRWWLSGDAPGVIAVQFRHENPYYDDSYAVNSANLGPYGDAITQELMTELDRRFRTVGEPWARTLTGGSTGGWEVLAQQVFYPDLYAGTWATCPDSVDFRYHQIVNMYEDESAYFRYEDWTRIPRPSARDVDGDIRYTMEEENHFELAIGTRGRSGGQWDIWEAVFSPQGPDGYPARAWDKRTGDIDHAVAERWRAFDLRHVIESRWAELGPRLAGKLHIYTGDDDTYYLENAVQLLEQAFARLADPAPEATIEYGNDRPHCYSPFTPAELVQEMHDFMADRAPAGAALQRR